MEPILDKTEILLFKYLNSQKEDLGIKSSLMEKIKLTLKLMGLNPDDAFKYYYLYTSNYRPKGDYENLNMSNIVDYKKFKQKKISNTESREYVKNKIPFRGSNLEGYWDINNKNEWYYIVESYSWYPIHLFINNRWYEISDRYSSSTGKHISYSRPSKYSNEVESMVTLVSRGDMDNLRRGVYTHKDLMLGKRDDMMDKIKRELLNKTTTFQIGGYGESEGKIKYKISNVKKSGKNLLITVDILDVTGREGRKSIPLEKPYTSGEYEGLTPEDVENRIKNKINTDFINEIGSGGWSREPNKNDYFLIFKFNHME